VARHRSAVDLLAGRDDVDARRIGLVGHDFGAMHGVNLAADDARIAAAVFIAATPRWGDWFLRFWKLDVDRFAYLRRLAPFDPIESARGLAAKTLWQFSSRDYFIAPMSAVELARAAPGEPVIEWYEADHAMRSSKARASRATFLRRELGLG
jgi:pimeloyl-ACP methyl ester carboxylesterase